MQSFTYAQTKDLITGLTRMGVAYRKPVVMGEWGVTRAQVVTDKAGNVISTGDPNYEKARDDWYRMIIRTCYLNGCAGTNIWMLADWSGQHLQRQPLQAVLRREARRADREDARSVGLVAVALDLRK